MNFKHRIFLSLALAGLAASSQAALVTVRFDNPIFSGVPAPSYDVVTITYPKLVGTGSQSATVAAGRLQGTVLAYSGVDPSIFVDNLNDLFMYCYDLYDHINHGQKVDYTINLDGEQARTLDFLGAVNAVLNQGAPAYDNFAWLHPRTGAVSAAIQLGIWESRYEIDAWNIAGGSFKATGIESNTLAALGRFFGAIDSSDSLNRKYVMTLEAPGVQDMITGDPPATVPEPGTSALIGAALAGMLLARRRPAPPAATS
jgi:hypothetical protein